jgi:hypothetical protein
VFDAMSPVSRRLLTSKCQPARAARSPVTPNAATAATFRDQKDLPLGNFPSTNWKIDPKEMEP